MRKTLLLAMSVIASLALTTQQAVAEAHSHFIKVPETVDGIWKEIGNQQTKLTAIVANGDLAEAHDHGYAIRDLVKALPDKVPAESKAPAEAAAKEVIKIAAAIDKSGAAGAKKATEANVKKLEAAITKLKADLKAK